MSDIAIKVEDLGKLYRLGEIGTGTISHDLNRWLARIRGKEDPFAKIGETNDRTLKGDSDYVWALKDVNFEVKKGEVLGIIGRNGAGKSTLLKILSKVTTPSKGRIKVNGRIASLLEVGTGFHPELTGRENIFLNGAILGMTKTEIRSKFDEIVDFAGVERYIDTPVKRYSSGMYVRLAFAVAAFLEPEILIIDEVLAVGDAEFQKKCLGRMQDVSKNDGRTILFVSHNMGAVKSICNRGVLLEKGTVKSIGEIEDLINDYEQQNIRINSSTISNCIKKIDPQLSIVSITINSSENNIIELSSDKRGIDLKITGEAFEEFTCCTEIKISTPLDVPVLMYAPGHITGELKKVGKGSFEINERLQLPAGLTSGSYKLQIFLTLPNKHTYLDLSENLMIEFDGVKTISGREIYYKEAGIIVL